MYLPKVYVNFGLPLYSTQAYSVQNNPGYDSMSLCNCKLNIVIINIDTVYNMSLLIWKCEVHIWTHGCLACCMTSQLYLL
jgi:hypothetical protein